MEAIAVNVVIALALVMAGVTGYRRGYVAVLATIGGIIAGILISGLLYRPLGQLLASLFHLFVSLSNILSYVILFVAAEFIALMLIRNLVRRYFRGVNAGRFSRPTGAVLGVAQMAVIIAIILAVIANLPISLEQEKSITGVGLSQPLLELGNHLQNVVHTVPGGDLTATVTMLTTTDPESTKMVKLSFTTTDVKVDEVAENQMLTLINQERGSRGLSKLTMNSKAQAVARDHSRDMFVRGYFSHVTPEGLNPFDRMTKGGVSFHSAGENLALAPTVAKAHSALMDSPPHRANILSPDYHTVGIGVVNSGAYGIMVTQDFTD